MHVNITILEISNIEEVNMKYSVKFGLGLVWSDSRLVWKNLSPRYFKLFLLHKKLYFSAILTGHINKSFSSPH